MSQLYDLRMKIEEHIKASGLDARDVKGKLGLRSGKLLSLITPTTPDDAETISKLKQAIKEVMHVTL